MYMGIWGIGAFIGASVGPAIGGPLLIIAGRLGPHPPPPPQNSETIGYLCLFSYGSLCFFASAAILLKFDKKALKEFLAASCDGSDSFSAGPAHLAWRWATSEALSLKQNLNVVILLSKQE